MKRHEFSIQYSCVCDVGHSRTENQDNFFCGGVYIEDAALADHMEAAGEAGPDEFSLFAVFDGMGGEECGDVAAQIAARETSLFRPEEVSATEIRKFCFRLNHLICDYAEENDIFSMGTTAAFLFFGQEGLYLCNIGDSKIFRYDGEDLTLLSVDHLAPAPFGRKRPLSQNLGIPEDFMIIDPYIKETPFKKGDIFVLCSDGLTDMVSFEEIEGLACEHGGATLAKALVDLALENGGNDNVTVLAVQIM